MKVHREICGLPVIAESPSSYRICTPRMESDRVRSWIQFISISEGWTLIWIQPYSTDQDPIVSTLRWPTKEAVAQYLIGFSKMEIGA